jgi:signal peptidase I
VKEGHSGAAPWWKRWYVFVGFALAAMIGLVLVFGPPTEMRTFYLPSEAMMPTLAKDDRILAEMQSFDPDQEGEGSLRRGDIILFNIHNSVYIKRVAGLPGDRIAVVEGVVHLNGRPVRQRIVREEAGENPLGEGRVHRLMEQFPGEPRPHEIYDMGYSVGDDFAEARVRPGHVFVLGDNRDLSADSRFSHDMHGVEQLPITDVIGTARSIIWRPDSGVVAIPLTTD